MKIFLSILLGVVLTAALLYSAFLMEWASNNYPKLFAILFLAVIIAVLSYAVYDVISINELCKKMKGE